jgi:hypothetical protein
MLNRSKAWALALLAIVLAAGVTAGWTAARWRSSCEGRKGHGPEGMVSYLTDELNLNPAQQDSVRAVLARHRPALEAIWKEVHPRYEAIRARVRAEITAQLSPDQQARYQRLIAEREHQRRMADSARAQGQGAGERN